MFDAEWTKTVGVVLNGYGLLECNWLHHCPGHSRTFEIAIYMPPDKAPGWSQPDCWRCVGDFGLIHLFNVMAMLAADGSPF